VGWRKRGPVRRSAKRKRSRRRHPHRGGPHRALPGRRHLACASQCRAVPVGNLVIRSRDGARRPTQLRIAEPLGELHPWPTRARLGRLVLCGRPTRRQPPGSRTRRQPPGSRTRPPRGALTTPPRGLARNDREPRERGANISPSTRVDARVTPRRRIPMVCGVSWVAETPACPRFPPRPRMVRRGRRFESAKGAQLVSPPRAEGHLLSKETSEDAVLQGIQADEGTRTLDLLHGKPCRRSRRATTRDD
jgi:hypothetical protein